MSDPRSLAYFSMEIGHSAAMPTYSGGLGVLAGDTISAAADLRLPMVAVALLHRKGYFRQGLDSSGGQTEESETWTVEEFLEEAPARVTVSVEGRPVAIRAWQYKISAPHGYTVPVYLLDTDLPANSAWDRTLTDHLYGGDGHYRLCQEIVLGIGGVRILRALGYHHLDRFHINEGHAALLTLELLLERLQTAHHREPTQGDVDAIRERCVFTTHTPVPAGHDRFPMEDVARVLEPPVLSLLRRLACVDSSLNMTHLALHLSGYVNGVSQRHGEVSRRLFSPHPIDAVTNGVHPRTWVAPLFRELYNRYIPHWTEDSAVLRHVLRIPYHEVWSTHRQTKQRLLEFVKRQTGVEMDLNSFTIGFARRTAAYKRADLLFDDLERLRHIHGSAGPIQLIYAGKAHPHDTGAKEIIRRVFHARDQLRSDVRLAYLPNYDIDVCRLMTSGVDLWLNTPEPPLEASGTSGMKAALNGVPSLSVLDGWWVEGCIEGVTGWAIGHDRLCERGVAERVDAREPGSRPAAARFLYDKLEYIILPMFYRDTPRYVDVMKHAVAINGAYFSTHRMVQEYLVRAYYRRQTPG
ncbi:MAG: alpha-glucan family phosphorylase [Planctomycetes bacterium]|nr:alpha-glucan family phosphorylase [Planctomycetota bacterium]